MKFTLTVSLLLLLLSGTLFPQVPKGDKVLSRVGKRTITTDEFTRRYESSPFPGKQKKGKEKDNQLQYLFTVIAEKLWANEAELLQLDTMEAIRFSELAYLKMFTRDALFRNAIRKKVSFTDSQLKNAVKRNRLTLEINFLFSEDSTEINDLHTLLLRGMPFDTVLSARPEYNEQREPMEITYGDLTPYVEDAVYALEEKQFTKPLEAPEGWYIFYLRSSVFQQDLSLQDNLKAAEKTLRSRIEANLYNEYYQKFFKSKSFTVQTEPLKTLADKLGDIFSTLKKEFNAADTVQYRLYPQQAMELIYTYSGSELQEQSVRFTGGSFTLQHLILQFTFDLTPFDGVTADTLYGQIISKVRFLAEMEMLYNEGKRLGYHLLPEVVKETAERKDNYLFQALQNRFIDSVKVDDKELLEIYQKQYGEVFYPAQVNIVEVLCSDSSTAVTVFQRARAGEEIRALADLFNIRTSTKSARGEFGFFPVLLHGEIGKTAATMEVGDIAGPLSLPEGYSVFQVIGKKSEYIEKPSKSFAQVKEELRTKLLAQRLEGAMNSFTANLGIKYGINIDNAVFQSLDLTSINSVIMRRLGFGGVISASPLLAPNTGWVELYNSLKMSLP